MWSFFGRSHNYNLFIGSIEFLIGILVVFRRTRLIALLLSLGVCTNIVILNIEFDIDFAIQHACFDLIITLLLLIDYWKDLYVFFIEFGGKLKSQVNQVSTTKYTFFKKLPYIYVVIFPIGYFIFAYYLLSSVNEKLVGSYEIKDFYADKNYFAVKKGKLGSSPMIFFEHNNMVVLSINDSVYYGRYSAENNQIDMRFKRPIDQKISSIKAEFKDNSFLKGKINDSITVDIKIERLSPKKDYLNNMYQ